MALAGVGLIHLLDLPGTIQDTPYIGWLYIALIVGSIAVAFELLRTGARPAWTGAALLAAGAVTGYALSRTVGLPQSTDDIGNWLQPLGLASLFVEISLIALSGYMLALTRPVRHALALRPATATAA